MVRFTDIRRWTGTGSRWRDRHRRLSGGRSRGLLEFELVLSSYLGDSVLPATPDSGVPGADGAAGGVGGAGGADGAGPPAAGPEPAAGCPVSTRPCGGAAYRSCSLATSLVVNVRSRRRLRAKASHQLSTAPSRLR